MADRRNIKLSAAAESYGPNKARADARASALNADGTGWHVVNHPSHGYVVTHDGSTAPQPQKHEPVTLPDYFEVRSTSSTKRYEVYEGGKAIKDAKGKDKWFSTNERAEQYIAQRQAIANKVAGVEPAKKPDTKPAKPTAESKAQPDKKPARAAKVEAVVGGSNGGPSDQALKTAAKLEAVAKRTIEEAQKVHDQDRKMNTPRRARMGAGVMEEQQRKIANAKTAMQIASALREGTAGHLEKVQSLADVERLQTAYRGAMYAADRAQKKPYGGSKVSHEPAPEHIPHAKPAALHVGVQRWDVEKLQTALKGKGVAPELKRLAAMAAKDSYAHHDARDAEAVAKVVRAIKKHVPNPGQQGYRKENREARDLHGLANRWSAGVRDYEANKRLGLTDTESAKQLLSSYADARVNRKGADPVAVAERELIGLKLPGFFPTPDSLAKRMADLADIKPGQRVLEPSAGTGRLADAVKAKGATVETVEMQSKLRDILQKKGHNLVAADFTEMERKPAYDRIVMNPPFEKGQDMAHVKQAFDMLKPGGKLVAIMGEGAFFRGDKQATEFRGWLDAQNGTHEKLPEGTFKESNTGVNTRLVVITKPGVQPQGMAAAGDEFVVKKAFQDRTVRGFNNVVVTDYKIGDRLVVAKQPVLDDPSAKEPVWRVELNAGQRKVEMSSLGMDEYLAATRPISEQAKDVGALADAMKASNTAMREHGSGSPQDQAALANLDKVDREIRAKNGMEPHWSQNAPGWSDKAREASAEVRADKAKLKDTGVMSAVDRAMAASEARAAKQAESTLVKPAAAPAPTAEITKAEFMAKAEAVKDGTGHKVRGPGTNGEWVKVQAGTEVAAKLVAYRSAVAKPAAAPAPAAKNSKANKALGLLGPALIATAMLAGANKAKAEGLGTKAQVKEASKEGAKSVGGLAAFSAATGAATWGLVKAGMTVMKAAPVVNVALMAGNAAVEAYHAKPGERLKAAGKGAWDMSLPGMVVNTGIAAKEAIGERRALAASASRAALTPAQQEQFRTANAAHKAMQEASNGNVKQFERDRKTKSGKVVHETVTAHKRRANG